MREALQRLGQRKEPSQQLNYRKGAEWHSPHLVGGRLLPLLREHLEDLAIIHQLTARYQLQVCNLQPAHSTIQTTRAFSGRLFLVNHLLHTFSGKLRTSLHEIQVHKAPSGLVQ